MELVKRALLIAAGLVFFAQASWAGLSLQEADPYEEFLRARGQQTKEPKTRSAVEQILKAKIQKLKDNELPPFCHSAAEFESAYTELMSNELYNFPDRDVVRIAYEVTAGCDGAADRFKKVLDLLVKSGVDKRKSIELALHFAKRTDPQTAAFVMILKGTFLEKFMDMDFKTALLTTLKLALEARGSPDTLAKDFRAILNFCVEHKDLSLPFTSCAPLALELCQQSYLFGTTGLADPFRKLMTFFQDQKEIDYNLPTALRLSIRILRHGPQAVENFDKQFRYGISEKVHLPKKVAVELAVKVAENTLGRDMIDIK